MSKAKQTKKLKLRKLRDFNPKDIVFPSPLKEYKNKKFLFKSFDIRGKDGENEPGVIGLRSLSEKFSFGIRKFGEGGWSFHIFVGPSSQLERDTKEFKDGVRDRKKMEEIQNVISKHDEDPLSRRSGLYMKVIPKETVIYVDGCPFTTEEELETIKDRSFSVGKFAFEFDKVSICPDCISVKPRLIYAMVEFARPKLQNWDLDGIITESEEED